MFKVNKGRVNELNLKAASEVRSCVIRHGDRWLCLRDRDGSRMNKMLLESWGRALHIEAGTKLAVVRGSTKMWITYGDCVLRLVQLSSAQDTVRAQAFAGI